MKNQNKNQKPISKKYTFKHKTISLQLTKKYQKIFFVIFFYNKLFFHLIRIIDKRVSASVRDFLLIRTKRWLRQEILIKINFSLNKLAFFLPSLVHFFFHLRTNKKTFTSYDSVWRKLFIDCERITCDIESICITFVISTFW